MELIEERNLLAYVQSIIPYFQDALAKFTGLVHTTKADEDTIDE